MDEAQRRVTDRVAGRLSVSVAHNDGIDERAMREFIGIVRERRKEIEHAWREFFGDADWRSL